MLFCDKVDKRDIRIRFHQEGADGTVVWEDWAHFQPNNVHKQVAISFKTPKYKDQDIQQPVRVLFRLQTISDGTISNAIPFQYVPDFSNIESARNTKKRKIDDSRPLYEYLQMTHDTDNRQKSKMTSNINPNDVCTENIPPDNSNFFPSNFFASNNNLLSQQSQPQCYDSYQVQSPNEQSFQQHTDRTQCQPHQTDYQWPLPQPLQPIQLNNIQPQPVHHNKQFGNFPCEQPHYLQHKYQPMAQSQPTAAEPSYGNYSSPYTGYHSENANICGAATNFSSNNISNRCQQSQPMANYPMSSSTQHPAFQQMGPVYAADKVIIQQFCNNNLTFNQPQNVVADVENMGECINQELNLL